MINRHHSSEKNGDVSVDTFAKLSFEKETLPNKPISAEADAAGKEILKKYARSAKR